MKTNDRDFISKNKSELDILRDRGTKIKNKSDIQSIYRTRINLRHRLHIDLKANFISLMEPKPGNEYNDDDEHLNTPNPTENVPSLPVEQGKGLVKSFVSTSSLMSKKSLNPELALYSLSKASLTRMAQSQEEQEPKLKLNIEYYRGSMQQMQAQIDSMFKKKAEGSSQLNDQNEKLSQKAAVLELERWILSRQNIEEVEQILSDKKQFIPKEVDADIVQMLFTGLTIDNELYKRRNERIMKDLPALIALKRSDTYSHITDKQANELNQIKSKLGIISPDSVTKTQDNLKFNNTKYDINTPGFQEPKADDSSIMPRKWTEEESAMRDIHELTREPTEEELKEFEDMDEKWRKQELDFQPLPEHESKMAWMRARKERIASQQQEHLKKLENQFVKKMANSEAHQVDYKKEKEMKIKSLAKKEIINKQKTEINKQINDVTTEYNKLQNKTFKTIEKINN